MAASLVAQLVKNLPTMQETQIRSLGQEDPLEKGMATHSSILAWSILMHRGTWRAIVHGVAKSDMTEWLSLFQLCRMRNEGYEEAFSGTSQWFSGKESACNAGDPGSIPGPGRSFGVGNGSPFQYSCLENSIDRGAWWATVYEVENSRKLPIDFHFIFFLSYPREGTADRTYGLVENSLPSGHTNATYDY